MTQEPNTKERARDRLYRALAVLTYIFNFADLDYTLFALPNIPGSYEANPVFGGLLRTPAAAVAFKLLVIPALLYLMYRARRRAIARVGLWLCFLVYGANFALQAMALLRVWGG